MESIANVPMIVHDLFVLGHHVNRKHMLLTFPFFQASCGLLDSFKTVTKDTSKTDDTHNAHDEHNLQKHGALLFRLHDSKMHDEKLKSFSEAHKNKSSSSFGSWLVAPFFKDEDSSVESVAMHSKYYY
jgi:hypothetical protein